MLKSKQFNFQIWKSNILDSVETHFNFKTRIYYWKWVQNNDVLMNLKFDNKRLQMKLSFLI